MRRVIRICVLASMLTCMTASLWAGNPNRGLVQQGPNGAGAANNQAMMYYLYRNRGRRGYGGGGYSGGMRSNFPIFIDARSMGYPMPGF